MKEAIAKKNHELVYLYDINLVDEIWKESRPEPPRKPVRVHELTYAGLDVSSKLSSLRSELIDAGCSAIVVSMLDEVCWLLNLVLLLTNFLRYVMINLYNWDGFKFVQPSSKANFTIYYSELFLFWSFNL